MADFSALKSSLASSRIQSENNALYQTINGLISAVQVLSGDAALIAQIQALIDGITEVIVYEFDTSSAPQTFDITAVTGLALIKDISGNAAANNITLVGTVEGVVDPVINTNFGYIGIFQSQLGTYVRWVENP